MRYLDISRRLRLPLLSLKDGGWALSRSLRFGESPSLASSHEREKRSLLVRLGMEKKVGARSGYLASACCCRST